MRWSILLFVLALAVRLPALWVAPPAPEAGGFPDVVLSVAQGAGPSFHASGGPIPPGSVTALYPPLYPALAGGALSALGTEGGTAFVRLVQLLVSALTTVAWLHLAHRWLRRWWPSFAFAALTLADPVLWRAPGWLEPTALFQGALAGLLLGATWWLRTRRTWAIVAVLSLALVLPLLRSGLLEFALLLGLALALRRPRQGEPTPTRAARGLVTALPLLLVGLVAVWGSVNLARLGTFKLTTSSGLASVCTGPPLATAAGRASTWAPPAVGSWDGLPSQGWWVAPRAEPYCTCGGPGVGEACDEIAWDSELRGLLLESWRGAPGGATVRALRGPAQTVLPGEVASTWALLVGLGLAAALAAAAVLGWRREVDALPVALLALFVLAVALAFPPTREWCAIVRPALLLPAWSLFFHPLAAPSARLRSRPHASS